MLLIHKDSHLDHALTTGQLSFLLKHFADKAEFFVETVELPSELGQVPCGLYGPLCGDEPVAEADVFYKTRGDRKGESRMIEKGGRMTNALTVIAGPHDGLGCILFTAYGGPSGAPKEPWDCAEGSEREASEAFWADHALAPDA